IWPPALGPDPNGRNARGLLPDISRGNLLSTPSQASKSPKLQRRCKGFTQMALVVKSRPWDNSCVHPYNPPRSSQDRTVPHQTWVHLSLAPRHRYRGRQKPSRRSIMVDACDRDAGACHAMGGSEVLTKNSASNSSTICSRYFCTGDRLL